MRHMRRLAERIRSSGPIDPPEVMPVRSPIDENLLPTAPADHSVRLDIFRTILAPMTPGRLLDLAAGHGKFAMAAEELGWSVIAVDARRERFPQNDNITWVQSDVRDYEIGDHDVIVLLGILYHLELADQLDLLSRCSGSMTIIDTHVASRPEVTLGDYEGCYFNEDLRAPTASWLNETSFWPTEASLVRMLQASGYRFIFRLTPPPMTLDRTWYLCH